MKSIFNMSKLVYRKKGDTTTTEETKTTEQVEEVKGTRGGRGGRGGYRGGRGGADRPHTTYEKGVRP